MKQVLTTAVLAIALIAGATEIQAAEVYLELEIVYYSRVEIIWGSSYRHYPRFFSPSRGRATMTFPSRAISNSKPAMDIETRRKMRAEKRSVKKALKKHLPRYFDNAVKTQNLRVETECRDLTARLRKAYCDNVDIRHMILVAWDQWGKKHAESITDAQWQWTHDNFEAICEYLTSEPPPPAEPTETEKPSCEK